MISSEHGEMLYPTQRIDLSQESWMLNPKGCVSAGPLCFAMAILLSLVFIVIRKRVPNTRGPKGWANAHHKMQFGKK